MKTKKMNFAGIKNALSRSELKKIMAGSTGVPPDGPPCRSCGSELCCGNTFCYNGVECRF